jgi:acetolactate synthase I/II/III large subunit
LGASLGLALGVKAAAPDKLVVTFIGDGAFNYNPVLAAFGLMQEYGLPTLTIVFDNRGYTSMKSRHLSFYPDGWAAQTGIFYGAEITPGPDYGAVARMYGGHGEQVAQPDAIRPALQRAIEAVRSGCPALVSILLDPADPRRQT